MDIWKFKLVDLYTFKVLDTVEAKVDDSRGILLGLEEAAKKVVLEHQARFPDAFLDCDPYTATR